MKTKICVVGLGYVGLSNAIVLAQKYEVVGLDVDPDKINLLKNKISPIGDKDIQEYLTNKKLNLKFAVDNKELYMWADYVIIATPTNYNEVTNEFDTKSVQNVIEDVIKENKKATIIIKSTVPIGFTEKIKSTLIHDKIIFSPEFLREGLALHDNIYPSRIIVGGNAENSKKYGEMMKSISLNGEVKLLYVRNTEAEAIKLFSNTYLAMRVAFFNEIDTFALNFNLNTKEIIDGVGLDPRIGDHYNNPSFGYGGYCLPKDTRQILANYGDIPQRLIGAIVESNVVRKKFLANEILNRKPKTVGIYRLIMKAGSDNFRASSIFDIMERLTASGVKIKVYEPLLKDNKRFEYEIDENFEDFVDKSDVILANRIDQKIKKYENKIFSRDLFNRD